MTEYMKVYTYKGIDIMTKRQATQDELGYKIDHVHLFQETFVNVGEAIKRINQYLYGRDVE